MTTTTTATTALMPSCLDMTRLAVASFLARYREPTLTAYTQDLKAFLGWCQQYDLEVLRVSRGELEMYVRHLESRGYAAATVARRFGTVATFYKYAVIDGVISANPAAAVTRPKVAWEGQKRTVLHPLEFAALLASARTWGPNDHALVCLLGMLGLPDEEAQVEPSTRVEVDGEVFDVIARRNRPGQYHFAWASGPNPDYGFSSGTSDGRAMSSADIEASIRDFMAQVDPETGYIE